MAVAAGTEFAPRSSRIADRIGLRSHLFRLKRYVSVLRQRPPGPIPRPVIADREGHAAFSLFTHPSGYLRFPSPRYFAIGSECPRASPIGRRRPVSA